MTKRHAKPTSARKRKPPTTAQMVGRIPKWLAGFEERVVNQLALLRAQSERNAALMHTILFDSEAAREDNLQTLPALRRAIDREGTGQAHLRVTARTLVDHCQRLLKEKETLQRQIERMREPFKIVPGEPLYNVEMQPSASQVQISINDIPTLQTSELRGHAGTLDFQAARHGACAFASSHRAGIRCGVCGEMTE